MLQTDCGFSCPQNSRGRWPGGVVDIKYPVAVGRLLFSASGVKEEEGCASAGAQLSRSYTIHSHNITPCTCISFTLKKSSSMPARSMASPSGSALMKSSKVKSPSMGVVLGAALGWGGRTIM